MKYNSLIREYKRNLLVIKNRPTFRLWRVFREDLMNEFSGIIKNEKTTMTREKVLGLIENLMKLKSNYNCKCWTI